MLTLWPIFSKNKHFLFHVTILFLTFWSMPLSAEDKNTREDSPHLSLYQLFAGNTVTGYNTSGVKFSEYHAPDGRIFGHNSGEPAVDACWKTVGSDIVCYYYGGSQKIRGEFCWKFKSSGNNTFKIFSTDSPTTGAVFVEKGNPHNFTDHGKHWSCQPLAS